MEVLASVRSDRASTKSSRTSLTARPGFVFSRAASAVFPSGVDKIAAKSSGAPYCRSVSQS